MERFIYISARIFELIVFAITTAILIITGYLFYIYIWAKGTGTENEMLYHSGAVCLWSAVNFFVLLAGVIILSIVWYWYEAIELACRKNVWSILNSLFRIACFGAVMYQITQIVRYFQNAIADGSIERYKQMVADICEYVFFTFMYETLPKL